MSSSRTRKRKLAAIVLGIQCHSKRRRIWISDFIRKRDTDGFHVKLMTELSSGDPNKFREFLRINADNYEELLKLVSSRTSIMDTSFRKSISATQRLAVTLRFLATGESFRSLAFLFRIPQCTISSVVSECLDAIYNVLAPLYLKMPSNESEWKSIAEKFKDRWHFPNCLGAMDGKHIIMVAPPNSGSVYYNYKGTNSIVLLAIADAEYRFIYVDVGCNGRVSDGGVYNKCSFANAMVKNKLHIPQLVPLPQRTTPVPYVLALRPNIMKPYSGRGLTSAQRVFNFRLSHTRRIIENAFGILSVRFRVFRNAINLDAAKTRTLTLACCALHNYLSMKNPTNYTPRTMIDQIDENGSVTPGHWRNEGFGNNFTNLEQESRRYISNNAQAIRNEFQNYFMEEGEVNWQFKYI
ncbi:uncharacterized protein LOC131691426 [Topomyia yanbarensis]|uniref:uncharacterized protein LOC131691426 n=1 Tax=Topomyia yanbarensis TaxID=2498891 RepID=UPI00273BA2BC|nr:uncharacterized protein LOC131691426 [Topomyia yanbarensis]